MHYVLLFLFWPFVHQAQEVELQIKVNGIEKIEGKLMYRLRDAQGREVLKNVHPVKQKTETIILNLEPGSYALAIFHDANDNNEIDRGFTGIPTELYGFSNDARGMFGPPDLEDQLFKIKGNTEIKVLLQ